MNISKLYEVFKESLGAGPFYTTWVRLSYITESAPPEAAALGCYLKMISNEKTACQSPVHLETQLRGSWETTAVSTFQWQHQDWMTAHLGQQHENHITVVLTQKLHHFLIQLYELRRRSVGSKERWQERAEPSVLQNGLKDFSAFWFSATYKHLERIKKGKCHYILPSPTFT